MISKNAINPGESACDPKGCGDPSRVIRLSNLKDVCEKGVKQDSLSRITIGKCMVPNIKRPCSGSQMLKSPTIMPLHCEMKAKAGE